MNRLRAIDCVFTMSKSPVKKKHLEKLKLLVETNVDYCWQPNLFTDKRHGCNFPYKIIFLTYETENRTIPL